ncbi:MAG: helix-turn-helix domain-containing protein [Candidatus Thermoplasmatota archaeon]|nr:helix-turn-helix domain-containing protein [Candidatus Thermoplasmatota archaeon]
MTRALLTKNEEKVLYGLVKHPELNHDELSKKIDVKLSTLNAIKNRLISEDFIRYVNVPIVSHLGCELLAVIYTQFNPVIPLEERVKTTRRTIEVFPEIFFSVGEQDKGFSISLSKNYTTIGRINEIRTETFGQVGLLEKEYPNEVIFPFQNSNFHRFFDFSRLISHRFGMNVEDDRYNLWFNKFDQTDLTVKEKAAFIQIVRHPNFTTQQIGDLVGFSRHTVARMKKRYFDMNLIQQLAIPNLEKLGIEILAFYHIKFNPHNPPIKKDIEYLDTFSTIFLASKKFEIVAISAYPNYQDYKEDKMEKIRYLKEKDIISYTPLVRKYIIDKMTIIKDFDFSAMAQKIFKM